ncbi:hypothetical protein ILUMI_24722 [Ignelater luminosus]|uniref:G-protein coupled receptors family 2 profile 2 domain-containing protein n=1 Tax=Ignelater luminosus TaxID=2038154 RepID=A0A8K0C9P0_IGNLU|nr:hypothetical protein ILUMI_24722 [Ignelater luminosus]
MSIKIQLTDLGHRLSIQKTYDEKLPHYEFGKRITSPITKKSLTKRNQIEAPTVRQPSLRQERNSLESTCSNISSSTTTICPEGFQYIPFEYCWILKENQTFPPLCPYPHFEQDYFKIKQVQQKHSNKTFWVYGSRNTSEGFPEFEWISKELYGQTILKNVLIDHDNLYGKDCLIVKDDQFYSSFCSEKHAFICMYSYSVLNKSKAIDMCHTSNYHYCILADYDLSNQKCFCQKIDNSKPKRNQFCEKLAEPIYPFQTQLLILHRHNFGDNKCWIGLDKKNPNLPIYSWILKNEIVNYTAWTSNSKCKDPFGVFQFIKYSRPLNGWTLSKDENISCALCEVSVEYKQPSLTLQRIEEYIVLDIDNIEAISNLIDVDFYDIFCFSDSNEDGFKERLPIRISANYKSHSIWIPIISELPSYYWCEAFTFASYFAIKSNTILAFRYSKNFGHEFALELRSKLCKQIDLFANKEYLHVSRIIKNTVQRSLNIIQSVRPMRGYYNDTVQGINLLLHISTRNNLESAAEHHKKLLEILHNTKSNFSLEFSALLNCDVCLPTNTSTIDGEILEWPETRIGAITIPSNIICLDKTYFTPVTKTCIGKSLNGAIWGEQRGNCYSNQTYSNITEKLFNLTISDMSANIIMEELISITEKPFNDQVIDIHLISVILKNLGEAYDENFNISRYVEIVSNVMEFDKSYLGRAQIMLNSTDHILSSLDNVLHNTNATSINSSKLLVEIVDLTENKIAGLGLFKKTPVTSDFEDFYTRFLYQNTSLEDLMATEDLEIAMYLPFYEDEKPRKAVFTIFYNSNLFNGYFQRITFSKIVSVSTPGFNRTLSSPLRILFKNSVFINETKDCSYWDYGIDGVLISRYGRWRTVIPSEIHKNFIEYCEFFHLTHFGLFLRMDGGGGTPGNAFEVLTITGSVLSLIGIIPIFLTAFLYSNWRNRTGNIILLNFCAAITFQIFVTFAVYATKSDGVACKIVAACFHYSVLSEFCWMFIVAYLEYRRFVVVFNNPKPHFLKKVLLFGWITPLLPVVITVSISPDNYTFDKPASVCHIAKLYFFSLFLLPIILILINNLVIFIKIIYSLSKPNEELKEIKQSRNYKFEILLAILLFFILGFTWIFGIIAMLGGGSLFSYLFCTTATLRGVILFLFFIVGNKETRLFWSKRSRYYVDNHMSTVSSFIKHIFSKQDKTDDKV